MVLIFSCNNVNGQLPESVSKRIENYLEFSETGADYNQVLEDLTVYTRNPINLNFASLDELLNFPLVTSVQAIKIVEHRKKFGLFLSHSELQVAGIPLEVIYLIQPYTSLEKNWTTHWKIKKEAMQGGKQLFVQTLRYKNEGNVGSYIGNPIGHSLRYRYNNPGHFSFGITAEKDAGEKYWNRGPDFYSLHASVQNIGIIENLIAGDYVLSFGQGLVCGSGIGLGKSAMVTQIKRSNPALKPYTGVNEFMFHRGVAIRLKIKSFAYTAAVSRNLLDARLGLDSNTDQNFSSADLDGLHRTTAELMNKQNLKRTGLGNWLQHFGEKGNVGIGATTWFYDKKQALPADMYKKYQPTGSSISFLHFFQSHTVGTIHFFSEMAYCATNKTKALLAGLLTAIGSKSEMSLLFRKYDPGFVSPFATSFGNSTQNETGIYAGIKTDLSRGISWSTYLDVWRNPWLSYRLYQPSQGTDILSQLDYAPSKQARIYLRLRKQAKSLANPELGRFKNNDVLELISSRFHVQSAVSKNIEFQTRVENGRAAINGNSYYNYLVFIQLHGKISKTKTSLTCRYSFYQVPFYYQRIYAYENQLDYEFGTAAFYGTGNALYVLVQQKLGKKIKIGMRYSTGENRNPTDHKIQQSQYIIVQLSYIQ